MTEKDTRESLLFDNDLATILYYQFQLENTQELKDSFIGACLPLCTAIVTKIIPSDSADLQQDAAVKLLELLTEDKFNADKGTLYSFISTVMRNLAISKIRKSKRRPISMDMQLNEQVDTLAEHNPGCEESVSVDDLVWYLPRRFFNFSPVLMEDMARYLYTAITTTTSLKEARKTKLSLMAEYSLRESHALCIYNVAKIYLRLCALDIESTSDAIMLAKENPDKYYWSYVPELAMVIGRTEIPVLSTVFKDIKVKL